MDALADYGHYLVTTFFDGKEQKSEQGIWLLQQSVATTEQERA